MSLGDGRTVAESWRDIRTLLGMIVSADGWTIGLKWYLWRIDADGVTWVVPLVSGKLSTVVAEAPAMQGAAALYGEVCGLGVVAPEGDPLALTAYTPPRWPVVEPARGKERMCHPRHPDGTELRTRAWAEGVEYRFAPCRATSPYKSGH